LTRETVDDTALERLGRIAPDGASGRREGDLRQLRSLADQRGNRDDDARRNRDAEVPSVRGDRNKDGCGSKADDDQGRSETLHSADRRRYEVGADFRRILGRDRHQVLALGLQKLRRHPEESFARAFEHGIERRNDAGNCDGVDRIDAETARREELGKENAVFVGRSTQLGRYAPGLLEIRAFEAAQFRLGVADVDC
jgi:hypothetical protein